jgi:hypothetical protein
MTSVGIDITASPVPNPVSHLQPAIKMQGIRAGYGPSAELAPKGETASIGQQEEVAVSSLFALQGSASVPIPLLRSSPSTSTMNDIMIRMPRALVSPPPQTDIHLIYDSLSSSFHHAQPDIIVWQWPFRHMTIS